MSQTTLTLLQGTVDLLILRALQAGPAHGYAVSRWVHERTDGVLSMEDAALYQALHRLEGAAGSRSSGGFGEQPPRQVLTRSPATADGRCAARSRCGGATPRPCSRSSRRREVRMRPRGVKRLFAFPFRTRTDVRTDVNEEFAFHLDMRTEELVRLGQPEAEARAQALREFGNAARGAAACVREGDRLERGRRIGRWLSDLRQDVSTRLRLLGRSPGFALVATLTLALGIGANAAIFSTLDAVLLRPLPYDSPDRLVQIFETLPSGAENSVSGGAFLDWRHNQTQFRAITLIHRVTLNLRDGGGTERLAGLEASHELLEVLAVSPLLGRGFTPQDDAIGGEQDVVLLTEGLWRTRFGGDPSIVNRTIVLDETKRTVIGVLPAGAWLFPEDGFRHPGGAAAGHAARRSHRSLGDGPGPPRAAQHADPCPCGVERHQASSRPGVSRVQAGLGCWPQASRGNGGRVRRAPRCWSCSHRCRSCC